LLLLSFTNLITIVVKLFPRAVVRGIQLTIGLLLLKNGVELAFGEQTFINGASHSFGASQIPIGLFLAGSALLIFILFKFVFFKNSQRFPASLALLTFGLGAAVLLGYIPRIGDAAPVLSTMALPNAATFWTAFIVLVIPQLPLTLGNAVVGTSDTARTYFKDRAHRVSPRALTTSMGLANIVAGLFGAMPMCHGSGGLTAHYKLGARTGGANLMIGGLILTAGLFLGANAVPFLSMIPLAVLGVLLAIVGAYHALLIRDIHAKSQLAVVGTVAVVTIALGNLAFGFGAGFLLHYILRLDIPRAWLRLLARMKYYRKAKESLGQ
jgi:SulP family sulfate permease